MSGERERVTCAQWRRGRQPCRNRATYEGHITEGNWQPVCGRHLHGFNWIVPLAALSQQSEKP